MEFNGQWVFRDLLLHEMKASYSTVGCCKNHLWRSLKLVRNSPIDIQSLPSVLRGFETLQGAEKCLHQVSPMAVSAVLHSFSPRSIAFFPPVIDLWSSTGSGYLGTCSFMRWRPPTRLLDVARITCGDYWNLSGILQLMFEASLQTGASSVFQMLQGVKKSFNQVNLYGSLDDFTCFLASDTDLFLSIISKIDLGSSMHNGYSRTCCVMRWNSSYSTAEGCKYCLSLAEIIFVRNPPLIFKASPQSCVALKHSKGQRSVFIKWAPWQFRQCYIVFCFRLSHFFLRW